ncbi:NPP1 family protein [Actinomadura sp. 9N215]|uniref:NPP1 family protein n=1 Tax=Actinomadura sp. 9N215 TaxID=3375150 RepID=UPI0037B64986
MTAIGISAAALLITGPADSAWADPPTALPRAADLADLAYMPATDYDVDGCYPSPAIGPDGTLNPGLKKGGHQNGNCRDQSDLDNANVYSRRKCNNGWCAFMYDYYFEKDQSALGPGSAGHQHDWENIVVWVKMDPGGFHITHVSASQHKGYEKKAVGEGIQFENLTHPKMVYQKDDADPGHTHNWRFAKPDGGDEPPENHYGTWQYPNLVSHDRWPAGLRDKVFDKWPEGVAPKIQDRLFNEWLGKARPDNIPFDPNA